MTIIKIIFINNSNMRQMMIITYYHQFDNMLFEYGFFALSMT